MNAAWTALVNAAIVSAPLTIAVWLALRVTPSRALNAATRYGIWWMCLIVVVAMPGLFLSGKAAHTVTVAKSVAPIAVQVLEIGSAPAPVSGLRLRLPLVIPSGPWLNWLLTAWMSVSAFMLLRLLLSYRAVRRAIARASEIPTDVLERLRPQGRGFRIAASADVPAPAAVGPFRRAILLPSALLAGMPADDIEPLVIHEAAHLRRHDDGILLLERLVEAVFCLHPVVRWIMRQIDLEREIACDDLVVEATGRPHDYAAILTRAMALCGAARGWFAAAHATGRRPRLSRRVELLVDRTRPGQTRIRVMRLVVVAPALAGAAVTLASLPAPLSFTSQFKEIPMKSRTAQTLVLTAAAAIAPAPVRAQSPAQPIARSQSATARDGSIPDGSIPGTAGTRLLALYFDTTTLTPADRDRAVVASMKFVQTQLKPDGLVAVLASTADGFRVLEDFTGDSTLLFNAIQSTGNLPADGATAALPSDQAANEDDRRLANLRTVMQTLGAVPDRKILIYFASGMAHTLADNQVGLQTTINAALRANVAVYPIDEQGLVVQERSPARAEFK